MSNDYTYVGECSAKLAWTKYQLGATDEAVRLAFAASGMKLRSDDNARVELILARTARSKQQAIRHFRNASNILSGVEQNSLYATIQLELARLQYELAIYEEALESAEKAIRLFDQELDPTPLARAQLIAAQAAIVVDKANKSERALRVVDSFMKSDLGVNFSPRDRADYFRTLAETEFHRGDYLSALNSLQRARSELSIVISDNDIELVPIVLRQADVLDVLGRLHEALAFADWAFLFERRLNHRLATKAYTTRAGIHLSAGRYKEARRDFSIALTRSASFQVKPATFISLQQRKIEILLGKPAITTSVRRAISESKSEFEAGIALRLLAQEKLMQGRPSTAVSLAVRSHELIEQAGRHNLCDMLETLLVLSEGYIALGEFDQANRTIDQMKQIRNRMNRISDIWTAKLLVMSGRIHLAQGQSQNAASQFQSALDIWQRPRRIGMEYEVRDAFSSPEKAPAHLGLVAIGLAEANDEAVAKHWESAHMAMATQLSDDVIADRVLSMGEFCDQNGRLVEAIWFYQKAREFLPSSVDGNQKAKRIELKLDALAKKHTM